MYFPPPPCSLLWRSCEWHRGRGVCSCWVIHSFLPLFMPAWVCLLLWLKISRHQVSWRLEFSLSSVHLLPALPLGKGPQPGLTPHSLPQWCLWVAPGPARLLEVQTGCDSCQEGILLAGVLLWPLTCEPPATPGPPSLSVPTGLSVSFSVGLVTQPCNLTETRFCFFFFFLSWTLGPSCSPFWVAGRLHSQVSVPFPKPRCWVQSCIHSQGLPFCPCPLAPLPHPEAMGAQPAVLIPHSPPVPSVLCSTVCSCSFIPAFLQTSTRCPVTAHSRKLPSSSSVPFFLTFHFFPNLPTPTWTLHLLWGCLWQEDNREKRSAFPRWHVSVVMLEPFNHPFSQKPQSPASWEPRTCEYIWK